MSISRRWIVAAGLCVCAAFPSTASAAVTVILVRHAEKAAAPAADPPLTAEGRKRAQALAATLRSAGVTAIFETEYARTRQTAEPLAAELHLTPRRIGGAQTNDLVAAIRQQTDGVIVVVGHSNTVPQVIAGLGGPAVTIADSDYDSLFVLTIAGSDVSLLRLHYGDPSSGKASPSTTPMMTPSVKK